MTKDFINAYSDLLSLGSADQYEDEIYEIINEIKLFDNFSFDEVKCLCRYMQCYAAPTDFKILNEGDCGDYLILVLTGNVSVVKSKSQNDVKFIGLMGVGSTLGEMSMIDGCPRFASCTATVPTDFAVLTRESFNDVLLQMPRLGNKLLITLLQTVSARLREAIENPAPVFSSIQYGALV